MKSTNNFYEHFLIWQRHIYGDAKVIAIRGDIAITVVVTFIFCYALTINNPITTSVIAKIIICNDIVFIAMTVTVAENGFSYGDISSLAIGFPPTLSSTDKTLLKSLLISQGILVFCAISPIPCHNLFLLPCH